MKKFLLLALLAMVVATPAFAARRHHRHAVRHHAVRHHAVHHAA